MIKGKIKESKIITKENILNKVDEYNIFRYYLGEDFDFKKKFSSPFRNGGIDENPNLCFFPGNQGRILFKDFANGKTGDCFTFVQELFDLDYFQSLKKVYTDFKLDVGTATDIQIFEKPFEINKQSKLIQVIPKPFTDLELNYWGSYDITPEELKANNVFSVKKLYINKTLILNPQKDLRFAYVFDEYIKIYSPLNSKFKWISSTPNDFISGFNAIRQKISNNAQDEKIIISKSLKDQIVLSKIFKDVCSTQNESESAINQESLNILLEGYKPNNIYIAYDNDEPGVKASTYYSNKYNFNYVNVPKVFKREGIKDWADLVKIKDLDTVKNYLKIKGLFTAEK